ncbi:hypothetical protein BX591_11014 [Paraburkholderia bryophila]|jgi:hypothetical protein|uniref:Uncharacterized protein n=1 Tax=Paraburkholderia bryophila TaxID=420952 RepID=A0A329C5C8_9BURK|nr:hypothetical protein BX591_11014 [Paraburkholderia bryophila]
MVGETSIPFEPIEPIAGELSRIRDLLGMISRCNSTRIGKVIVYRIALSRFESHMGFALFSEAFCLSNASNTSLDTTTL